MTSTIQSDKSIIVKQKQHDTSSGSTQLLEICESIEEGVERIVDDFFLGMNNAVQYVELLFFQNGVVCHYDGREYDMDRFDKTDQDKIRQISHTQRNIT